MALTQEHDEKRTLTPKQVEERCKLKFDEIMALPVIEKAEVLEALYEMQARVRVKSTQDEDIVFSYVNSHVVGAPEQKFTIPGGPKPPALLPLRAAVYVASNRDYPQFGGASIKQSPAQVDGRVILEPIAANPKLISMELVLA